VDFVKILQLVESSAGGVGRHVMDLTAGLLARNHEVDLVYSDLRADRVFREDLTRLSAEPRMSVMRLPMHHAPHWRDWNAIRTLRKYVRERGPFDIVHCHSTKAGLIGRLGLAGVAVRRLYSPHGFLPMNPDQGRALRRVGRILESALARMCDGVVTVSKEERSYAVGMGIPAEKLCLIRNGVSAPAMEEMADRGALRRTWNVRDDEVCIGFVGRLVPVKAPGVALRAFAQPDFIRGRRLRLVVVGDGPLRREMGRLADSLGIVDQVTWLGEQNAKALMHAFDLLLLSSDSEANPLVVLEAIARGLPVVATSVGGIAETVRHGVNGFVAPVRGVREIATALETLASDAELRVRMGKASLELFRNFSVDRMVDQTAALYSQVASGSWKGGPVQDMRLAPTR
jgi:glycosyltransferase involved in cell wall biosynthesis